METFSCETCGKQYKTQGWLTRHLKKHEAVSPVSISVQPNVSVNCSPVIEVTQRKKAGATAKGTKAQKKISDYLDYDDMVILYMAADNPKFTGMLCPNIHEYKSITAADLAARMSPSTISGALAHLRENNKYLGSRYNKEILAALEKLPKGQIVDGVIKLDPKLVKYKPLKKADLLKVLGGKF